MVEDIKLQISLFQYYKIPTLPLHSQRDSSDIAYLLTSYVDPVLCCFSLRL